VCVDQNERPTIGIGLFAKTILRFTIPIDSQLI
jgi:hypothetical protein